MTDPADPDAEFNRLRESVTEKKESKTKTKKVSLSRICCRVKVLLCRVFQRSVSALFCIEEYAHLFAPSFCHIATIFLYVHKFTSCLLASSTCLSPVFHSANTLLQFFYLAFWGSCFPISCDLGSYHTSLCFI